MMQAIHTHSSTEDKTKDIKLNKILIKSKKAVYSDMAGNTITKMKGDGYDFSEIREYVLGDDIKKISWNTTAKTNKLHIKLFNPSKELNINIVSLLGGSVHFGSCKLKQDVIAEVCAILAFSSCAGGDPFGSFIYTDELMCQTKKTKKINGVKEAVKSILSYDSLYKQVDYANLGDNLYTSFKQKSVLFLIGDFAFAKGLDIKALSKKHDLMFIIIRDKIEEELANISNITFKDPVYKTTINSISNKRAIDKYKKTLQKSDLEFELYLKKLGVSFVKIYTHQNPIHKLRELFL